MVRNSVAILVSVLTFALASCGSQSIKPLDSEDSGAVIGNLKVPGGYRYINLNKLGVVYAAPFKSPPQAFADENGNFIFENLSPGQYYLLNVSDGHQVYQIATSEAEVKKNLIDVKAGQIVFIGSLVFANIKKPLLATSTFEITRANTPDEKTIIKELIPHAKNTGWDKRLEAKLRTLK
jgi:hypothetical protein